MHRKSSRTLSEFSIKGSDRTKSLLFISLTVIFLGVMISACNLTQEILQPATETPTATQTSTIVPSPTPTPTPTPAPTLVPLARIKTAERALFNGDYDSALNEFIIALETNSDSEIEAAARLGIGRAQLATGDQTNALVSFRKLVELYPDSLQAGEAQVFLATIFQELARYEEAAAAYQSYLDKFPGVLDSYIYQWQAENLFAAGKYPDAIEAYNQAINSPRLPGMDGNIQLQIARTHAAAGDISTAIAICETLSNQITSEFLKPTLLLLHGELLIESGQVEQGYALYQNAIKNYPESEDSYIALLRLLDTEIPVNELHRGVVDYYAEEYSLAVFALDRYLAAAPEGHDGQALFYKGLSLREIDSFDLAIDAWNKLIRQHDSSDPYWDDAWEEIGDTQWAYLDNPEAGIITYEAFVARVPEHPRAAEFLFFSGQVSERNGLLDQAVSYWERLTTEYPTHWLVARAHFLAGITHYRLGDYPDAISHFQTIESFTDAPLESSQAAFWIGKTQVAMGDPTTALLTFERAAAIDPTGYYSERARDSLNGEQPFLLPEAYDLAIDWENERAKAEDWMKQTFALAVDTDFTYPGPLASDIRFIRGTALWNLGYYELARAEFESLRNSMASDPVNNYRLASTLFDLGMYRTAIFSARQVLNLADMDDAATMFAPPWFNYIRFGTYYAELIFKEASEKNIHPLIVWSVMRQESLFEGFVQSTAGARGLMQIIPSTGAGIHRNLGWPVDYSEKDLYRPIVNVRYGVDYLADQLAYFSGETAYEPVHLYAALAAYNGGPGNSAAWLAQAQNDPDLFLEIIRFNETQRYVRGIYEIFNLYNQLYDRSP